MSELKNSIVSSNIDIGQVRLAPIVRRHSARQRKLVRASLNKFGQVRPVLVGNDGEVIDGELIVEILKETGAQTVWAVVISDLSSAEEQALRLLLHESAAGIRWDLTTMRAALNNILAAGVDLQLAGLDVDRVSNLLNPRLPKAPETKLPSVGTSIAPEQISQSGDIWNCAGHRIVCGNPTATLLAAACEEITVDVGILNLRGEQSNAGCVTTFPVDEMSTQVQDDVCQQLTSVRDVCVATGEIFLVVQQCQLNMATAAARVCGMYLRDICVRIHSRSASFANFPKSHSFILVLGPNLAYRSKPLVMPLRQRRNNLGPGPTRETGDSSSDSGMWVNCILKNATKPGDVFLSSGVESGIALAAAEATGRLCVAFDANTSSVDRAIQQWQESSNAKARHRITGVLFGGGR